MEIIFDNKEEKSNSRIGIFLRKLLLAYLATSMTFDLYGCDQHVRHGIQDESPITLSIGESMNPPEIQWYDYFDIVT